MNLSVRKKGDPFAFAENRAPIGWLVRMVTTQVATAVRNSLRGAGVSAAELAMLRILGETPVCRPSDIADAMGVGLSTVSKITYRLLDRSLVSQTPAGRDHRCKYLRLTADGRRMVEDFGMGADLAGEHVFEKLSGDERQQLMKLLLKLV